MLPFNGPLPHLVLPPNHWIKLVVIVLHCLYWELLEFIKKKKKNQTWLICTLFQIQIFFFFFTSSSHPKKKTKKTKTKNKTKEG